MFLVLREINNYLQKATSPFLFRPSSMHLLMLLAPQMKPKRLGEILSLFSQYFPSIFLFKLSGSVAQKKAFFEAHYKRIAAQKAAAAAEAAAAAALLEQEKHKLQPGSLKKEALGLTIKKKPALRATKFPSSQMVTRLYRAQTPVHPSASGSKTIGPKWRFLAMDFSKPLSACRNKPQSPIISSPFNLRTEERACVVFLFGANRFVVPRQMIIWINLFIPMLICIVQEKAESELKKLRQSLCFKARPLPEFYKERKPPNNTIHMMPWPQSDSPNPGRKPSPSRAHDSLSSQKPAIQRSNGKQDLPKKNGQKFQNHIRHTSLAEMIRHENMSPNILF